MGTQVRSCPKCFQLMWLKEDHYDVLDEGNGPREMSALWIDRPLPAGDRRRQRRRPEDGPLTVPAPVQRMIGLD
jgi:hypothetical protein